MLYETHYLLPTCTSSLTDVLGTKPLLQRPLHSRLLLHRETHLREKQSCLLRKTFPNFVTLPKEETCSLWAIRDLNRPRPPPSRRARRFSALFMRKVYFTHSRVFYLYEVGGRIFFGKHGGFYELLTCPSPPFLRASVRDGDGRGCRAQRQR